MDRHALQSYVEAYKQHFDRIRPMERYKWKAVRTFQNKWNPKAHDFYSMLEAALHDVGRLMDSGNYFPKRMILRNAKHSPRDVRAALLDLFDEDESFLDRVMAFKERMSTLTSRNFRGKQPFQDVRAAVVYLTLRYPDTYFFYKFGMLRDFCARMGSSYAPKVGEGHNLTFFMNLCMDVRATLTAESDLVGRYFRSLEVDSYADPRLNLLVQDFIYAVTRHLDRVPVREDDLTSVALEEVDPEPASLKAISFKARLCDHVARQMRQTAIGCAGEDFVFALERARVGGSRAKLVQHTSRTQGDGAGYDIESVDDAGQPLFIEVKTTRGAFETPFYLSSVEVKRSRQEGGQYALYRVYDFDMNSRRGKVCIVRGDLTRFCGNPTQFEVRFQRLRPAGKAAP